MAKRSNRRIWIWGIVALAAVAPYLNALTCGFAYDDEGLIEKNSYVSADASWIESVTTPYWPPPNEAGLYRPVVSLSYHLQLATGGGALVFHLFNIFAHLGVCLLVFSVLRKLLPLRQNLALVATLIFAVHPLHTEAVTGITGRAELLSAGFALAGYRLWLEPARSRYWLAICLCFALASASKESAVGWFLLLGAHRVGLLGDGRHYGAALKNGITCLRGALAVDGAAVAGFGLYCAMRYKVLGTLFGLSHVDYVDNPIYSIGADQRIITALQVMAKGIGLTLWPVKLSADYSAQAIVPLENWINPAALMLPALLIAVYLCIRYRHRWPVAGWALALYLVTLLPVSNLLVPIGTILGERLLYVPSLGLIVFLLVSGEALLGQLLGTGRSRFIAIALVGLMTIGLAGRTWSRNPDWNSSESLFESVVATQPESVRGLANLASAIVKNGEIARAERLYRRSLDLIPNYQAALVGLGYVNIMRQNYAEAEELLTTATEKYPRSTKALLRLGNLYLEVDRAGEGLDCFDKLLDLDPCACDGWVGKASAHFMLTEFSESAAAWEKALEE